MQPSDERLIRKVRKGDHRAFETLVDRHKTMVFNVAYRMLRNREDAEDAAQESFLRAFNAIGTFRTEAKFSTWLYRIVSNVCLSHLGRTHAQQTFLEAEDEEVVAVYPEVSDRSSNPEEIVSQEVFGENVRALIVQLAPQYRAVITLYYLQEFSYAEISEILDLPMGTVKTHLYRAKGMLKRAVLGNYALEEISDGL